MGKSNIEWTDMVWNPVTGCTKVSPGCQNCYAERMFNRFNRDRVENGVVIHNPKDGTPGIKRRFSDIVCHYDRLDQPLHWKKHRRIFVCSMGDPFHEDVVYAFIGDIHRTIEKCPQHIFLILTKRPERAYEYYVEGLTEPYVAPNLWLGVTAENQEQADKRIPILLQIPAAKRFVSMEPLLSGIDLKLLPDYTKWKKEGFSRDEMIEMGPPKPDWFIIGAESGAGRRECKNEDVRNVVGQCKSAGVPVFVKQLSIGRRFKIFKRNSRYATHLSKNMAEWPEDLRVREYPT